MSISPIRKNPLETQSFHQESRAEEAQKETPDPFEKAENALSKAIDHSICARTKKLQCLPLSIINQVKKLETSFSELRLLCLKICTLHSEAKILDAALDNLPSDDENEATGKQREKLNVKIEELEDPIEEVEQKMKSFIQGLADENQELGVARESFSDWWQLERIDGRKQELSLRFMEEQLLNHCVNRICFLNELKDVVEKIKLDIFSTFFNTYQVSNFDLKQVSFRLFPHGSETHNRGKVPVKITFSLGETELNVFFKPRDARIDEKIVKLFHDLNALTTEEKSLDVILPTYIITNMSYGTHCFSLWEFIGGKHLQGQTASDAIRGLSNPMEKERLYVQLVRLESVCKFLNISDLHLENLIFTNPGEENSQVVPIDLESVQPGNTTGLFTSDPEIPPFKKAEKMLLEKCKQDIGEIPVRFIPIPTSHFLAGLTRCDAFIAMAGFVGQSIQKKGYKLSVSQDELEWFILNDFLHNDVPYLTEYKFTIYYGHFNDGNAIAGWL